MPAPNIEPGDRVRVDIGKTHAHGRLLDRHGEQWTVLMDSGNILRTHWVHLNFEPDEQDIRARCLLIQRSWEDPALRAQLRLPYVASNHPRLLA